MLSSKESAEPSSLDMLVDEQKLLPHSSNSCAQLIKAQGHMALLRSMLVNNNRASLSSDHTSNSNLNVTQDDDSGGEEDITARWKNILR